MILSPSDLHALTGYTQHAAQLRWLREKLRLTPPTRADGLPVVTRAQVEAALNPENKGRAVGPRWSKVAA